MSIHIVYDSDDREHPIWSENIQQLLMLKDGEQGMSRIEVGDIYFDEESDMDISLEECSFVREGNRFWLNIHVSDREWRENHGTNTIQFLFDLSEEPQRYPPYTVTLSTGERYEVNNLEKMILNFGSNQPNLLAFDYKFDLRVPVHKVIEID